MNRISCCSGFRCTALAVLFLMTFAGCGDGDQEKTIRAESQVKRIADDLDKRTTSTGAYVRAKPGEIKEDDPWGTRIDVSYSQGGMAEIVHVRSAGRDRKLQTEDDVVAERMSVNLKGVGEGIKQNAEETASNAAKGLVKGAVQGIKDSLPRKKKIDETGARTPE